MRARFCGIAAAACATVVSAGALAAPSRAAGGAVMPLPTPTAPDVEGYASETSVRPGGLVHLHVTSHSGGQYLVRLYQFAAPPRSQGSRPPCAAGCGIVRRGTPQPAPAPDPATGLIRATWPVTDVLKIAKTAQSGYYFALLVPLGGALANATFVPIIVRPGPAAPRAKILVQVPVNTWQAYNAWGGKSLYAFNSVGGPANHVSFDRPYVPGELALNLSWELPFVAFAERSGFSVDYQTDIDTAQDPSTLNGYRLVISLGHDEYWSKEMRDAFEAALARGQNLAFLGADIAEWQIRYDDLGRTVVEYRDAGLDPSPDPATKTTRFRSLDDPRPECRLLGVSFDGGILAYGEPHHDFVVTADGAADPWLAGTGFHAGDVLAASVGFEWDHAVAGCTPPQTVFFHADTPQSPADVIRYRAASGGYVFSTSSLDFLRAIDNYGGATPDPRLQAFLRNALAALSR